MKNIEKIWEVVTGNSNETDKQAILSEIGQDNDAKKTYDELKNAWALLSSTKRMPDSEVDGMYARFKQQFPSQRLSLRIKFRELYKYAAIFILGILVSCLTIYFTGLGSHSGSAPVLTTTVIGDKDQISKIVLPDSSVVWVNSHSKITYNNKFGVDNRAIKLVGQAFFQAAKNKKLPMVVTANKLEVKVLGTRFDVSAYPEDKSVKVVLESGKVELNQAEGNSFHYKLAPGEMATYTVSNSKVVVDKVDTRLYTSWKEGLMIFRDDPMAVVINQLERRFNISIEVSDPEIYKSVFTATINNEPLDKILKAMEFSCSMKATLVRDSSGENQKLKVILSKPKLNP